MMRAVRARVLGATTLLYRATGIGTAVLFEGSLGSGSPAERLAFIATHACQLRLACVLAMTFALYALINGALMHAYTRGTGGALSTLGLMGRVTEAALFGVYALGILALVSIATSPTEPARVLDARLALEIARSAQQAALAGCFFFAAASGAFACLLMRGGAVPRFIAALGLFGSAVPLAGMPLQMIGALRGFPTGVLWIAMFLFELMLAGWLLASGGQRPHQH